MSPDREPGDSAFWETQEPGAPPSPPPPGLAQSTGEKRPSDDNPVLAWARAIAMGVRDTAKDVLDEGRSGAKAKRSQMWDRFDKKTKGRRARE